MNRISCLIVDDEPLATQLLTSHIKKLDFIDIVGICHNSFDAINFLQKHKVDLLLLDIQMPQMNGIELLKVLPNKLSVIFTTAFTQYAIEGFELNVVDYLVKPISFDRFLVSINKLFHVNPLSVPLAVVQQKSPDKQSFIYIRSDKKTRKIYLDDIQYLESVRDFVKLQTTDQNILASQTISYFEDKLPDDRFLRVHRSFIVGLSHIEAFTQSSIEIKNVTIPIGRIYKQQVLKILDSAS